MEKGATARPMERRGRPWYRDWLVLPIVLVVLAVDQLSKYLIRVYLAPGESFPSDGTFRIHHIHNTGGAFGFFPDQTFLLIITSFFAVVVLLVLYRRYPFHGLLLRLSLGLQLGGAVGNLIDRLRLGHVTDFIRLGWWPVFNLADASIVAGIVILVGLFLLTARSKEGLQSQGEEPAVSNDETLGADR
jgi:signal peptidase II